MGSWCCGSMVVRVEGRTPSLRYVSQGEEGIGTDESLETRSSYRESQRRLCSRARRDSGVCVTPGQEPRRQGALDKPKCQKQDLSRAKVRRLKRKPDAGNPRVRFDKGGVETEQKRPRCFPARLYKVRIAVKLIMVTRVIRYCLKQRLFASGG